MYIYMRERACTVYSQASFFINVYFTHLRQHVCVYEIICIYIYVREREIQKWHTQYTAMHYLKKKMFYLSEAACVCVCVYEILYIV